MPNLLYVDGLALWSPTLPGWQSARAAFCGSTTTPQLPPQRPAAPMLSANERRRAPDGVLLALEVAAAAVAGSGHAAATLASVFTSAHGDLAIADALCQTLAHNALALSPTRFHHSVHNAASGYWAIAAGSHAASTALAAGEHSFAHGLLEAACQCAADTQPVLLVGHDTEAVGPMRSVNHSHGLLAVALLLAPQRSTASRWALRWQWQAGGSATPLHSAAAQALAANAMAAALPLFEALATGVPAHVALPVSATHGLRLQLTPLPHHPDPEPAAP